MKKTRPLISDELKASDFGEDFAWGTATSAYQIEGAMHQDGKVDSIWDVFSRKKRKVKNGDTGEIACDHYHRYQQDVELLSEIGVSHYRFSISWARVLPEPGHPNQAGIDFYHRLIDSLLAKNIEPFLTIYHWDMPASLQKKGGWASREIVNWFAEFCELCGRQFSDRVKSFVVLNEPFIFLSTGYLLGLHAPGKIGMRRYLRAVHYAMLAQAEGARRLRDLGGDFDIGTTHALMPIYHWRNNLKDEHAAIRADNFINHLFLRPTFGLPYPFEHLRVLKKMRRYIHDDDLEKVKFDFDFLGINHYTPMRVKANRAVPYVGFRPVKPADDGSLTAMGWEVYPPGMFEILRLANGYGPRKIYITENGMALKDKMVNGQVKDMRRVQYLQDHLQQVFKAKQEGMPIEGYFLWSFLDNFEWAEGYEPRFGIVYVDYKNQQRVLKDSGKWYKNFLKT